jgi:carbon starvation protein
MIGRESDIRMIGYGSMLLEGLVAITALLAAATLPQGDYWAINIDLAQVEKYADKLEAMGASTDHLVDLEKQVGGETLRGRTGGAVTLAVGMAKVMTDATRAITSSISIDGVIKYWYHFAIMFEALFILTTIDTGTRIARFLFQEILGKLFPAFAEMNWLPGVLISSSLVTLAWGGLIWSGSIQTIWPMFGIANQLLSGIALAVVTTYLIQQGRAKYAWVTIVPMLFVVTTTLTAGSQMIMGPFATDIQVGWSTKNWSQLFRGSLCTTGILFLLACFSIIVVTAITKWFEPRTEQVK